MRGGRWAAGLVLLAGCCDPSARRYLRDEPPPERPPNFVFALGRSAAATGCPLVRELGRLTMSVGGLLDLPSAAIASNQEDTGEMAVAGIGGTLAAALNLSAFFVTSGRNVDLARDAGAVNDALAHIEKVPPEKWRIVPGDTRTELYPRGTRVRPEGRNLIWVIPGEGEILQSGEESPFFRWVIHLAGEASYGAQERTWGMIVPDVDAWDAGLGAVFGPAANRRYRAATIIHEFYHQYAQLRHWFHGWSVVYWPAYGITYMEKGWFGHWAERQSAHAAESVDNALRDWNPEEPGPK